MRTRCGIILAVAAALAAAVVFADKDVYDNEIQYNAQGEVTYRFWYADETAEELSGADAVSASASPSVAFEPRYLTWAASDGKCPARGMCIIIR